MEALLNTSRTFDFAEAAERLAGTFLPAAACPAKDGAGGQRELGGEASRIESHHWNERLRVIDPGIVRQRASWPDVPLNVITALLLTAVSLAAYLTVSFSYDLRRSG